jgi:hypothetical protein
MARLSSEVLHFVSAALFEKDFVTTDFGATAAHLPSASCYKKLCVQHYSCYISWDNINFICIQSVNITHNASRNFLEITTY